VAVVILHVCKIWNWLHVYIHICVYIYIYIIRTSSLLILLHLSVSSSLLGPKRLPSTLFPKAVSPCSWLRVTDNMKIWSTFELSRLLTGWCLKCSPPSQTDMLETVVHRRFLHCQGQRVLDQWISHHHPPLITPSDQSRSSPLLCILDKYNNTTIVQHSFVILPFVPSRHVIYSAGQISSAKRAAERRHVDDGDEDVWGFLISA